MTPSPDVAKYVPEEMTDTKEKGESEAALPAMGRQGLLRFGSALDVGGAAPAQSRGTTQVWRSSELGR